MKIGFIGFGNMASAIYFGARASNKEIASILNNGFFYRRSQIKETMQSTGLKYRELQDLVDSTDIIILGVKPFQIADILKNIKIPKKKLWVSIMAGKSITFLETLLGKEAIARVMPNTPCQIAEGMTTVAFSDQTNSAEKTIVLDLFNAIGKAIIVPEKAMHITTAVAGSGPAFFYRLTQTIVETLKENGLSQEDARLLATQSLIGAGKMMQHFSEIPLATLTAQVTSKGGTTEAGIREMEKNDFLKALSGILNAASNRSKEIENGI